MRLYLDDDSAEALLIALLQQAGHDVQIPADAGMIGQHDSIHLAAMLRTRNQPRSLPVFTISDCAPKKYTARRS